MPPISHANVVAAGDDLVVTWRGGADEMSVFVSTDPDDAGVDVRAPDAPGRVVVGRGSERLFVHLFDPDHGFTVVGERRIEFDGPANFRDLGGYPTVDGGVTRWGRAYRSDRLDGLSDADHEMFGRLGITTVFDLRAGPEAEQAPDRLPPGVERIHLPMSTDVERQRSIFERIEAGDLTRFDVDDLAAGYLRMLEGFGDNIALMVRTVAAGEPVLFHCTAGKDRTGITAMVLLGLAGVADGHILDDYEMTNLFGRFAHDGHTSRDGWFAEMLAGRGLELDDFETLWLAPRPAMQQTVSGLRDRWGDHLGYATAIGLDSDDVAALRAVLYRAA